MNRMMVQIISLLLVSLLFVQSGAKDSDSPPVPYEDADAYEVYAAVLPLDWVWRDAKAKKLVIRSATTTYEMCLRPEPESEKIIGSAIANYLKQNEKPKTLQRQFNLEKPYELLTASQIESAFGQGGWDRFYEMHPDSGGYIQLSAVGFNATKTVAVVYMGHHCGLLCGGGQFYVLQKRDGKWQSLTWQGNECAWAS
jgi:hypothetical protein